MSSRSPAIQMVSPGTPPHFEDAIFEIRSVHGIKRITNERLTDITMESWRLGERGKEGTEERCKKIFGRLIEKEVTRV
jgi:hypothetical protein